MASKPFTIFSLLQVSINILHIKKEGLQFSEGDANQRKENLIMSFIQSI
jgi:hypothetical protein